MLYICGLLILNLLGHLIRLYKRNKNFAGYFIAALAGVIVQYLIGTTLLINYLGWGSKLSFAMGFIVSFPVGFFMTKALAFDAKNSGKTKREMAKYLMTVVASGFITVYGGVYSIAFLQSWFGDFKSTVPFTNYQFSPSGTIGHFMGMGMSFVFNYIVHKRFTFAQTGLWDKVKGFFLRNAS